MRLDRVLKLQSCDFGGTVGEALPFIDITSNYHRELKARMAETRKNLVPVLVEPGPVKKREILGNGHHRVKIAYELGFERLDITDDGDASGFDMGEVII